MTRRSTVAQMCPAATHNWLCRCSIQIAAMQVPQPPAAGNRNGHRVARSSLFRRPVRPLNSNWGGLGVWGNFYGRVSYQPP